MKNPPSRGIDLVRSVTSVTHEAIHKRAVIYGRIECVSWPATFSFHLLCLEHIKCIWIHKTTKIHVSSRQK